MVFPVYFLARDSLPDADTLASLRIAALVVDLASATQKPSREEIRQYLAYARTSAAHLSVHIRINSFASGAAEADLQTVMPAHPDAIHLTACENGAEVQKLDVMMSVLEAETERPLPPARIFAEHGATAAGVLSASAYTRRSARLAGLVWHAEALARHMGLAETERPSDILNLGRTVTLLRAREAQVPAFLLVTGRPARGFAEEAVVSGFSGLITDDREAATEEDKG